MKRLLLTICCSAISILCYSQQIDTLYYDKEWKGVDNKAFADYYRITAIPEDPNYPKRFRDFTIDGRLQSAGNFISIDKFDDSKSVFDGKCTQYHTNGNIASEANYIKGVLDGPQTIYNEDGTIQQAMMCSNGEITAIQTFYENGKLWKDIGVNKGQMHGEYKEYYDNGTLGLLITYVNGIEEGPTKYYDNNGQVTYSATMKDYSVDGAEIYYQNGTPVHITNYDNGLPIGVIEDRQDGSVSKTIVKQINGNINNNDFRLSCEVYIGSVPIKETGKLLAMYGLATGEKYKDFLCFDLRIKNDLEKDINLSINNVKVEYINKGKTSDNLAYSENDAVNLFEVSAQHTSSKAYADAAYIANAAATQTTRGYSSSSSYNSTEVNSKTNSNSSSTLAAIGASIGGLFGSDNSGNSAAVSGASVGGVAGASSSQTNSTTSGRVKQSSDSYSSSSSTYTDGLTRYQVYNTESEKAAQIASNASADLINRVEAARYSHISIDSKSLVLKRILADTEKKYDTVKLSFTISGIEYNVEFTANEVAGVL